MLAGLLCSLGAGLLWGVVFVAPLMLADYPGIVLSFGRYLAFGVIALVLAWFDRRTLARLTRADWREAAKLALVGNLLYYAALASAIQLAGAAVPTLLIGTLPVVISATSNLLERRSGEAARGLPWARLAPSLAVMGLGIVLVHGAEGARGAAGNPADHALGIVLALLALACWTWYPIRNARWLKTGQVPSRAWATAQGLATLPLAAAALAGYALWDWAVHPGGGFPWPLGPQPLRFAAIMLFIGLAASWLGTLLWNRASRLLPASLAGQLIVFETLAALLYAYSWLGKMPSATVLAGIALLVAGVVLGVRAFQRRL
jgi:drug/metabolite transporter (DMT)-like permease